MRKESFFCDICGLLGRTNVPATETVAYQSHRNGTVGKGERRALDLCAKHGDLGRVIESPKVATLTPEERKQKKPRRKHEPRDVLLARGVARWGKERLTCDVCGWIAAAPTGLGAHKRWTHGVRGATTKTNPPRPDHSPGRVHAAAVSTEVG